MEFARLGLADSPPVRREYREVWALQRALHARVAAGELGPQVLFVEHEPVYTAGRRTTPDQRPIDGTPVIDVDRGGLITYHGPGQLVAYPLVTLPRAVGPLGYVRRLEEALIRTLRAYGIEGGRVPGRTGVWLQADGWRPERKIAAIGIRVSRQTTLHGLALNVAAASLGPFAAIVPCGIADAGVTSLEGEWGRPAPTLAEVADALEPHLRDVLAWRPLTLTGWTGAAASDSVPAILTE